MSEQKPFAPVTAGRALSSEPDPMASSRGDVMSLAAWRRAHPIPLDGIMTALFGSPEEIAAYSKRPALTRKEQAHWCYQAELYRRGTRGLLLRFGADRFGAAGQPTTDAAESCGSDDDIVV